jgi:porphobilinogen synthase
VSSFPITRLRRLRRTSALRGLVQEARLSLDDFVQPLFVGPDTRHNDALPPLGRFSVDDLVREGEELVRLGVRSVILFGIPDEKDEEGSGAWDEDGVIQRSLRALRERFPELLLLTDVCLCEYTSHGHCGVIRDGEVDNDASLELLARTAVSHTEAGADAVCPSDMMDGRVAAIRRALDEAGQSGTSIVSYAVKMASAFYGPFRLAADSAPQFGDRSSYQMPAGNRREARREWRADEAEGADLLLFKPALSNLDLIRDAREGSDLPLVAYQVSGEYAMLRAAADAGLLDFDRAMAEALTSIRRAGADLIVSYHARKAAGL